MPDLSGIMNSMNSMGMVIFLVTAIPFVLIALFLIWRVRVTRRRVHDSLTKWERTTGTVLSSMVETRTSRSSDGGTSTAYYPKVVYEYSVMGQRYHSDRFNLGEIGLGFYNRVAAKVAQYPAGKMIDVYYNPDNPVEAVLERSAPSSNVLGCVVVVILATLLCTGAMMLGGFAFVTQLVGNFSGMMTQIPR